ncbi:hypothetical protein PMAYCL1PPCAC_01955 [Pristionchus mayeri]|uniref:Uncharacterized protein n=1 Tax=Pristionchus mayeri TaxID=1317129 RepID=A0AAN5C5U9_9BILA|nr:hypothetical protein PMAYCL1PPCAC_01955 [Pristionchus mayeri]
MCVYRIVVSLIYSRSVPINVHPFRIPTQLTMGKGEMGPSGLGDIANQRLPSAKPEKPKLEPPKNLLAMTEIRPYLFLSGFGCITQNKIKQLGITHAVDCTNLKNSRRFTDLQYLEVPVDDTAICKASQYFETVANFIEEAKNKGGKVVVFCAAGISRAPTFTLMYLIQKESLSLKDAYFLVNELRPIISPNAGFWQQMIDFEAAKNGESSVKLIRGRMARPVPDVYLVRKPAIA